MCESIWGSIRKFGKDSDLRVASSSLPPNGIPGGVLGRVLGIQASLVPRPHPITQRK